MQKAQIVAHFLVPPDQDAPEAIHPTVCAFYHPPPGFAPRLCLQRLGFFPPCPDVGGEAKLLQEVSHLVIIVAFIQAQPLRRVGGWIGPLHSHTLDGLPSHLEILAVRTVHREPERHAATVGEEAALGAVLAAVRGVLAHLFPPREGLWSWLRPSPAMPSQCPVRRHILRAPVPIRPRKRPPPSTLGSDDGPHCASRARWRPRRPTGSRCGARRKWHPSLYDHRRGADGTPRDGACAAGGAVRYAPTRRPGYASHWGLARACQACVRLL